MVPNLTCQLSKVRELEAIEYAVTVTVEMQFFITQTA
mgnify:CR=1 FL=1